MRKKIIVKSELTVNETKKKKNSKVKVSYHERAHYERDLTSLIHKVFTRKKSEKRVFLIFTILFLVL